MVREIDGGGKQLQGVQSVFVFISHLFVVEGALSD
jgi:hypothetical protein